MGKLETIRVKGYKSIKDTFLELKSLNVLIGANGAGKTNLVSVFTLLNEISQRQLNLFVKRNGGAEALLHFGQKTTERIEVELYFGANSYSLSLVPTSDDSLVFEKEFTYYNHTTMIKGPAAKSLGSGHSETNLQKWVDEYKEAVPRYVLSSLKRWKVYHFHDTSPSAKVRKPANISDNNELRSDASNIAAFLFRLQKQYPENYKRIVSTIRLVAPFFDDFTLRPDPLNPEQIRLEWKEIDSDVYMNAAALSDGSLRFICLATLLQLPKELQPSAIIVDEPELGLHPYAIVILGGLVKKASSSLQVILSTQSVQLVNQFSPEDLVVVDLAQGVSQFRRMKAEEIEDWMAGYSLGELWEKNLLGGRPSGEAGINPN